MENNNLNPEREEREVNTVEQENAEAMEPSEAVETAQTEAETAPQEAEAAGEAAQTVADDEVIDEVMDSGKAEEDAAPGELEVTLVGDSLIVIPTTPVKKKTGLIAGIAAAVLAVVVVAAVVIMGQSPEKVVKAALTKTYADMQKQSEQVIADIPVLAKQAEIAKGGSVSDVTLTLNSLEAPGLNPMVATVISGSTISGTTKADTKNSTYDNSYTLSVLGQKLGTLDLFASPTVLSVGLPVQLADHYYLDVDTMVENGWDSYLFSEAMPTPKEDLQRVAEMYKSYIESLSSMNTEAVQAMTTRMGEICKENLTELTYGKDGDLYTVTIPSQSVNATIGAIVKYIYLESPMTANLMNMLPAADKDEFIAEINNIAAELEKSMPKDPTVIKLGIKNDKILSADILTEGIPMDGSFFSFWMTIEIPDDKTQNVKLKFGMDDGEQDVIMNMNVTVTYGDRAMDVAMNMDVSDAENPVLTLNCDYTLDGKLTTNNVGFNMEYVVISPMPEDNIQMIMALDGRGDYSVQDNGTVMNLNDIGCNITSVYGNESIPMGINLGMKLASTPLGSQLTQPEGIDALTLNASDFEAIVEEISAAVQQQLISFLGKLA